MNMSTKSLDSRHGTKRTRRDDSEDESSIGLSPLDYLCDKYKRPLSSYESARDSIDIEIIHVDDASKDKTVRDIVGKNVPTSPIIRIFGSTKEGTGVCIFVHGFYPYVYFPVSVTFEETDIAEFQNVIKQNHTSRFKDPLRIIRVERVKRESLMHYRSPKERYENFLKITVSDPRHVSSLSKLLNSCDELEGMWNLFGQGKLYDTTVYESNVTFELRAMVDGNLIGGGCVTVQAGQYEILDQRHASRFSLCALNVVCHWQALKTKPFSMDVPDTAHDASNAWRIMAIDLTTIQPPDGVKLPTKRTSSSKSLSQTFKSKKKTTGGNVSEPSTDIAHNEIIGYITCGLAQSVTKPFVSSDQTVVFTHSFSDVPSRLDSHSIVCCLETEEDMIIAFKRFLLTTDPDIITGYDLRDHLTTLFDRADALNVSDYNYIGRVPYEESKSGSRQIYRSDWVRSQKRMAQAASNRSFTTFNLPGRLLFDLRQIAEHEVLLRTYKFEECVRIVVGKTKEVLDSRILGNLFTESSETRLRGLRYVQKDMVEFGRLFRTMGALATQVELARVTGLNIQDTFERGQMMRFWSQLLRYCHREKIVIPNLERDESGTTEGPLNMTPEVGLNTQDCCVVLDFKSLYPSIMIAHNLCYSTVVFGQDAVRQSGLADSQVENGMGPLGSKTYFVKADVKKGVVPRILEEMIAQRAAVRKRMKNVEDEATRIILDGRQRALKVSTNAIYGFTGATTSKLRYLAIAETTLARGHSMLKFVKEEIEREFTVEKGFPVDCSVIYGDTDSVFVKMPQTSVQEAFRLGNLVAEHISGLFPNPIALELQHVYFPYLMVNRKRYAGLLWSSPDGKPEVDAKGLESQRRDSCPLLVKTMSNVISLLFPRDKTNDSNLVNDIVSVEERQACIQKAVDYTKFIINRMLKGEFPLGEFIMSRGLWLGTQSEDYKATQAHVKQAEKNKARGGGKDVKEGERVSFVYVLGPQSRGYEKTEDPQIVLQEGRRLDYRYYLRHQFENQLTRIFGLFLSPAQVSELFNGEHTHVAESAASTLSTVMVSDSKAPARRGITSFFQTVVKNQCWGCARNMKAGEELLCADCGPKFKEIYHQLENDLGQKGRAMTYVHSVCRQCQASVFQDVLCVNGDCPIYYSRLMTNNTFAEACKKMPEKLLEW